jgi:hypothetical protein
MVGRCVQAAAFGRSGHLSVLSPPTAPSHKYPQKTKKPTPSSVAPPAGKGPVSPNGQTAAQGKEGTRLGLYYVPISEFH